MTTTPTAQELEHMIADGKIKLGARPAPVAPTAQEASEAQPCPRFCKCDNCRRYAELLDAMREIGRAPPAASPPESAAPDEICPQCGEYSVAKFSPCPKCGIFGKREPKAESAAPVSNSNAVANALDDSTGADMSERVDLEALAILADACRVRQWKGAADACDQAIAELRRLREFVGDYIDAYEGHQLSGEPCDALAQKAWELWEQVHPSAETLTLSEQNSGREG